MTGPWPALAHRRCKADLPLALPDQSRQTKTPQLNLALLDGLTRLRALVVRLFSLSLPLLLLSSTSPSSRY